MGPKDFSRSTPVVSREIENPGKCLSIARRNLGSYAVRAARFAVGDRRSRSRQISSFVGRVCPSRCTASRSVPFFTSASSTRRTVFRSADHRCSRHLLYSPEIEYFACDRSNATAPSSTTTAPEASFRKSCTVRVSDSGVMPKLFTTAAPKSVTDEHRECGNQGESGSHLIRCGDSRPRLSGRVKLDPLYLCTPRVFWW